MYKIYNPKTKRYINFDSNLGKTILQNSKKNYICPIDKKFINVCDKGLISENPIDPLFLELQNILGEFVDLYSVINNTKKLCGLDFSNYTKKRYKTEDKLLINQLIDYTNTKDIHYIHYTKNGGMYLKTIFFHKDNLDLALKLMKILWFPCSNILINEDYQIALGILFGYSNQNIIHFIQTRYNFIIDENYINKLKISIDNMNVKLEDLNKVIYVQHIENI